MGFPNNHGVMSAFDIAGFLGGLSLHLNHLIGSIMTYYDWSFGTLPFLVKFGHKGP